MKYFESFLMALLASAVLALIIAVVASLGPFVFGAAWVFGVVWALTHILMNKD